ncbi:non-ribosomal peptide synthetase [Catenuloplanes indicus]|uniref:Amino acid adenylation domain-containing protein n=1 Tax=Catenuloplanes indicus TaxID=137267 RepID=A0AAE3W7Q9_9ACTN|nr:non-ribosomal peptide synthetase [Catenuloplanes indicus]MDQ0371036.1 amino acid adenylation domain-containing protein [Catenuloplanes indicus]
MSAITDVLPLSPLQEGLLFLSGYADSGPDPYTVQLVLDLRGPLGAGRLRQAANALLDRHPHLRAAFWTEDVDRPVALVPDRVDVPWTETDLSGPSHRTGILERAEAIAAAERARRLDLTRPPLFRFHLLRLGPDRHRLLVTSHHLLLDGWSTAPLIRELLTLYRAPGTLPEPARYRDYLAWLAARDRPAAVGAWRADLAGAVSCTPFSGPARPSPVVHRVAADIDGGGLIALTRELGVTLNTVLQCAWLTVLAAAGGGPDVVTGQAVSGRPAELPGADGMIGLFLNTVPVRARLRPAEPFADLLRRHQAAQAALREHAWLDLPAILNAAGQGELFDSLLVVQTFPGVERTDESDGRLTVESVEGHDGSHYPVMLTAAPGAGRLRLELKYRDGTPGAAALLDRLLRVLTQIIDDPAVRTGAVTTLDDHDRSPVTTAPAATVRRAGGLPSADARAAVGAALPEDLSALLRPADPAATALVCDGAGISAGDLRDRADRLAAALQHRGIGPESVVGLATGYRPELVAGLLAVLRTGAAYLPLDLDHPPARLRHMIDTARPDLLLTTGELPYDVPQLDVTAPLPDAAPKPVTVDPDHAAYVLFTSGSTGTPKAVIGTRGGLAARLRWMLAAEPATPGDVVLAKSSIGFVDGSTELLGALAAHVPVVLAGRDDRRDPLALIDLIERHRITRLTAVPTLLRALAEHGRGRLGSVNLWISSGEPLTRAHTDGLTARVVNLYGCSEASGDSTYLADARRDPHLGTPITGTAAYVLDAWLRPVPVGGVGELYLSGAGLARGYLRAPAATADRFVAHPFVPGARLYRTGDLVRRRADGGLDHLGRTDEQVKVRGHRIEPAEIESVLATAPGVSAAAVTVHDGRLTAYLAPGSGHTAGSGGGARPAGTGDAGASGARIDLTAVRAHAAGRLAEHQLPSIMVVLERLPMTPTGKVARRELPKPDPAALTGTGRPRTPDERALARIFADVLGLPEVGVHDGFTELGGDSILSIRLVNRAREAGLPLRPRDVFEHRTVAALAAIARHHGEDGVDDGEAALRAFRDRHAALRDDPRVEDVLPLTPLQAGMFFLAGYDREAPDVYTMRLRLRLRGPVDEERLRDAARRVIARHPALRASFVHHDGEPVQIVRTAPGGSEPEWNGPDRRFDLGAPPLIRFALDRVADGEHRFTVTNHHLILDGWSVPLLVREIFATYAGLEPDTPAGGHRAHLRWLATRDRAAAARAWRDALDGLPGPTLLAGPAAAARPDGGGADLLPLALPAGRAEALTALARRTGVTLNTVLQLAWATVLARATGRDDVVFGATVSGRDAGFPDAEATLGLLINTVPVRVRLPRAETVAGALRRVQAEAAALLEHRHAGLADVLRWSGRRELFDTLLVFESFPVDEDALHAAERAAGLDVAALAGESVTHYPLTLTVLPGTGLDLILEYRPDLFTADAAARLGDRLLAVLAAIVAAPDAPLAALPSAGPAERELVLTGWNDTSTAGAEQLLPDLFAACVRSRPDAPALVLGGTTWTFAETGVAVDRIAGALQRHGVGPEDRVAVLGSRTPEAMAAMLAVLASGAAYLPIDPSYPAERIRTLLTGARPAALLHTPDVPAPPFDGPVLSTDAAGPFTAPRISGQHPAYVVYTSGSTGTPKGVVIPHAAIANLYRSHRRHLHEPTVRLAGRERLRVAHAWPFAFDAAWQPQLWLFSGHAVHLADEEQRTDPAALAKLIDRSGIDFVEVAPAMLAALDDLGMFQPDRHTLSMIGFGGDAVGEQQWRRLANTPGLAAVNLYGPTECTVDSLAAFATDAERPVIGRPVDNARAYVLDANLSVLPPGVPGELYLAGAGLARGYLDAPAATAARFVASPFEPGGRLYRTGDLVRWTENGTIDYLGRTDDQVKIRGYRVELGEVQAALAAHPDVAQAEAAAPTLGNGRRILAGYVVPRAGRTLDPAALKGHLAARLPDFLVPAAFVVLDRLPLTGNGKVDRARLPRPDLAAPTYRPPATDAEHKLCAAFAEALGVDRVGVDDDFFALGGDSLATLRLVALTKDVSPRDVFTHRTPGALAAAGNPHPKEYA